MNFETQNEFLRALFQLKSLLTMEFGKDGTTNINMPEYILLRGIYNGTPMNQVREFLSISKPAISQMLKALDKQGYITRTADKADRRNIIVRLTPQGEAAFLSADEAFGAQFGSIINCMQETDMQKTTAQITKLNRSILTARKKRKEKKSWELSPTASFAVFSARP